jgi:hypothetical protein
MTSICPLASDGRALTEAMLFRIAPPRSPLKLKKPPFGLLGALKMVVVMLGRPCESRSVRWARRPLLAMSTKPPCSMSTTSVMVSPEYSFTVPSAAWWRCGYRLRASALSMFSQKAILPVDGATATTPKSLVGPFRTMAPSGRGSEGLRWKGSARDTILGVVSAL